MASLSNTHLTAGINIDEAATAAKRDPKAVRRIFNLVGLVTASGIGREVAGSLLVGPPAFWIDRIHHDATELGFDGFTFWPVQDPEAQAELFAAQVLPELRARTDLLEARTAK